MLDYLVVGFGLAGLHIAHVLEKNKKSFSVIDPLQKNASRVSGGLNCPVIFRHYTQAWKAETFLPKAEKIYKEIEKKLEIKILKPISYYKQIDSYKDQNDWFVALDKPEMKNYLSPTLTKLIHFNSPFDYGEVFHCSLVDVPTLIQFFSEKLQQKNQFKKALFDYRNLEISESQVSYKNITAKKIIFCEGIGIKQNPFFRSVPVSGNKGVYLIIHAPDLKVPYVLKAGYSLIPLGNDLYKFGATFDREYKEISPETKNKKLLQNQLDKILTCSYKVKAVVSGIRPTIPDHRPVIGKHFQDSKILICNGFGSHGIMTAPSMAKALIDMDLYDKPMSPEIDVNRFFKKP